MEKIEILLEMISQYGPTIVLLLGLLVLILSSLKTLITFDILEFIKFIREPKTKTLIEEIEAISKLELSEPIKSKILELKEIQLYEKFTSLNYSVLSPNLSSKLQTLDPFLFTHNNLKTHQNKLKLRKIDSQYRLIADYSKADEIQDVTLSICLFLCFLLTLGLFLLFFVYQKDMRLVELFLSIILMCIFSTVFIFFSSWNIRKASLLRSWKKTLENHIVF